MSELADPVNDIEGVGYALMPNLFPVGTLDRVEERIRAYLGQLSGQRNFSYQFSATGPGNVPESGSDKPCNLYVRNGFAWMNLDSISFIRMLDMVYKGEDPKLYEFDDPDVFCTLSIAEEFAKAWRDSVLGSVFVDVIKDSQDPKELPFFVACHYQPGANVFGIYTHFENHRDAVSKATTFSIQASYDDTLWRISRNLEEFQSGDFVGHVTQKLGDAVALDTEGIKEVDPERENPYHHLFVKYERISVMPVFRGPSRQRLLNGLRELGLEQGYETAPAINTQIPELVRGH